MPEQRPYLSDRLITEEPEGFYVIVPADAEPPVPLGCPVCDGLLRSRDDEVAYREFCCCDMCALQWAHPRRKEWAAGWRPLRTAIESVVAQRPPLQVTFSVD